MTSTKTVYVGAEVQNVLTGERFTYKGKEKRNGEELILLESDAAPGEGQTHRVDLETWKGFFISVG